MENLAEIKHFVDEDGRLTRFPRKRRLQLVALFGIAAAIEKGRFYDEKAVNEVIERLHTFHDCAMLRRFLVEAGILKRDCDGGRYWLNEDAPSVDDFENWVVGRLGA